MASLGFWRRRNEDSTSSAYSSATTVSSRGLYRNMPNEYSPPRAHDAVRSRGVEQSDSGGSERRSRAPKRGKYLPCFVKSRRSTFETDEELEVRLDETNKREVWVRKIGFPSQALVEALTKAELVRLEEFRRAYPILVVTEEGQRKRGLLMQDKENSPVEYLNIDSGRVEKIGAEGVFAAPGDLLSIPNAAIRCELDKTDEGLDHKLLFHREVLSEWTRTRVHFKKWADHLRTIPTVLLSWIEPNFEAKRLTAKPVQQKRKVQKLYEALPGILIPPAFSLLKNCSVLSVDDGCAFIVQNDAPFEIDPCECGRDLTITPSLREKEQLYLKGDVVLAPKNEIEMRVVIGDSDGSSTLVHSVDSGSTYHVWDIRDLKPLLRREPPKALKVSLPPEYRCRRSSDELEILLRTGVFDIFFENDQNPPAVRLFTLQGIEMPVCVSKKVNFEFDSADIVSGDDRGHTRPARG